MKEKSELSRKIAQSVGGCDETLTIQPVDVGRNEWRNELLLFVKPEIFLAQQTEHMQRSIELVLDRLDAFNAHINGIVIVGGQVLDRSQAMSRHYGFINQLSRSASRMLDDQDLGKVADALEVPSIAKYELLGGHEYLARYADLDPFELDALWLAKKSLKIRSGFYVQSYDITGKDIILVNGFHPAQLAHYTDPTHRIVLILVHSDTPWAALRNEMVGATFPEKALPESIRGTLYAQPATFGLDSVSIANNGVHLSAGPFEGLFEITNFFGNILGLDLEQQPPLLLQRMIAAGLDRVQGLRALDNPILSHSPKPLDLFTATEDVDTGPAVDLWKEHVQA